LARRGGACSDLAPLLAGGQLGQRPALLVQCLALQALPPGLLRSHLLPLLLHHDRMSSNWPEQDVYSRVGRVCVCRFPPGNGGGEGGGVAELPAKFFGAHHLSLLLHQDHLLVRPQCIYEFPPGEGGGFLSCRQESSELIICHSSCIGTTFCRHVNPAERPQSCLFGFTHLSTSPLFKSQD